MKDLEKNMKCTRKMFPDGFQNSNLTSKNLASKMISGKTFISMALSFPGTEQVPHFERIGFKIIGKRMFASYLEENNTTNIFLTPNEQAVFCEMDAENIYPVPNKWGERGATTFELNKVSKEVIVEALLSAYNEVLKPSK